MPKRKWVFSITPRNIYTGIFDFQKHCTVHRAVQKCGSLGLRFSESSLYKMKKKSFKSFTVEFINIGIAKIKIKSI